MGLVRVGRALARRRRRRAAGYATAMAAAAAAITAVAVIAATGGTTGPAATRARATTDPAATWAGGPTPRALPLPAPEPGPRRAQPYVVRRVENALAHDDQVMRETTSVAPTADSSLDFEGLTSYELVTWSYRGRNSTETFGAYAQLQDTTGTGIVNGKLWEVEVDYIRHQWYLTPGMPSGTPVTDCTTAWFQEVTGQPGPDWPSLTERTLACGGYKMAGYARIDGALTLKITGSVNIPTPPHGLAPGTSATPGPRPAGYITTFTNTLFVSPSTYLPVRVIHFTTARAGNGRSCWACSTDFRWLPPTAANRARASVTVPRGYQCGSYQCGSLTY